MASEKDFGLDIEKKELTLRQGTIMQYEVNPKTGESFNFSEANILNAVEKKTIKEWAYILHDKDPWTQEAFDAYVEKHGEEPDWEVGEPKPRHWHVAFTCSPALPVSTIAKWFNVPKERVQKIVGQGAFLDAVEYLTHESEKQQLLGKHLYSDKEVKSNVNFRELLNKRNERKAKYGGRELSPRDRNRYDVLYRGIPIREIIKEDPVGYQNDYATLDKLRAKYIAETAPLPDMRINYYIYAEEGKKGSGVGKGLLSKALARSMYPHLEKDDDIFFEVGSPGSTFDGYDGQPVIIWNDRRGSMILAELGGKVGNVYNVFDTTPTTQRQNVKYASVKLINEVNIVNSVQSYSDFIDEITGANQGINEDKNQAHRRFPFIIPMRFEDFDILVNKGFMNDTNEFSQYLKYGTIRANMQRLQIVGEGKKEVVQEAEARLLEPVIQKHNEFIERRKPKEKDISVEDILAGTSFIEHQQQYEYIKTCSNCESVWRVLTLDPEEAKLEKFSMFCDNCQPPIADEDLPF